MNPVYSQSMVEPISVQKHSATEIVLRYKIRPESSHYSGGVDYERVWRHLARGHWTLRGRCPLRTHGQISESTG